MSVARASEPHPLLALARALDAAEIPFMVVGAHALVVHGTPRFSADIDVAVHLPVEQRKAVRDALKPAGYRGFEWVADEWGKRWRCLGPEDLPVELFFAAETELHRREFERRVVLEVLGRKMPFVSPEDLVLRKLVNCRMRRYQDFDDAVGVVRVQGRRLDGGYLRRHCGVHRVCALLDQALAAASAEGD